MNALGNMQRGSPPTRLSWRAVHDAWRGITRVELRAAFLLGAAVFLYHLIVYFDFLLAYRLDLITADFVSLQIRAFALMLCVVVADHVTGQDTRRRAAYALAVIVSAALAAPLTAIVWAQMEGPEKRGNSAGIPFHEFFEWVLLGGAVTFVYIDRRRARAARARLHAAEIDRAHTATRMLESRLQAMQARVEPQFLFNTLAQVKRLYRVDAVLAERMLGELIAYLRAAMPKMRDTSSTLAQEIELARAYLAIVKVRLGDRLTYEIESPPEAGDARMPPMMLLPLIDHVIVHGLEPSRASSSIRIGARVDGGKLTLTVGDSDSSFVPGGPGGDGIQSIRDRLSALYGEQGRLELRQDNEHDSQAVIKIPYEQGPEAG